MLSRAEARGEVVGVDDVLAAHHATALRVCAQLPDCQTLLVEERRRTQSRRVVVKADVRPATIVPVAPSTRKAQRHWQSRMRQRGGCPLSAERQQYQQDLRFCEWMNYGMPDSYGEEGEQELSRLQARVVLPDGRLNLSRRFYCGHAGRAMYMGEPCTWSTTGAVPPQLGSMNANGKEGPAWPAARTVSACGAVPPQLGAMNPYGGEGPTAAKQWDAQPAPPAVDPRWASVAAELQQQRQ